MIKFDDPSFSVELLRCDYCTNGSIKYPPPSNLASTVAHQHALRERHASPPCACTRGTNLTNAARLCTQEAPSTCRRSVPNGRFRPRLPLMRLAARSVREGGCGGGRRSPAGARGRTARDVLNAEGRVRAARCPSRSERRARAPCRAASVRFRLKALWDCTPCS